MNLPKNNGRNSEVYGLVTAAWNEELFIERTLQAVIAQTVRPIKWVIISDGSTDRTDEIVRRYAEQHDFISLHRITENHRRDLTAHIIAMNVGFSLFRELECEFLGNLDADISLEPNYFARLLEEFEKEPNLGLAGGYLYEESRGRFRRRTNSTWSVPNGIQLFRRECLNAIGGYAVLPHGSPDWHAEVSLRMRGWRVQSFAEVKALHHRPTGTAGGLLRNWYRTGLNDYFMGSHPVFEVFKLARRLPEKPLVLGALIRLGGFAWPYVRRRPRKVSKEFVRFVRMEQMQRLRLFMGLD